MTMTMIRGDSWWCCNDDDDDDDEEEEEEGEEEEEEKDVNNTDPSVNDEVDDEVYCGGGSEREIKAGQR